MLDVAAYRGCGQIARIARRIAAVAGIEPVRTG
jgi:hypothetical protein